LPSMHFYTILFNCSRRYHRASHSFPTRRSSDLSLRQFNGDLSLRLVLAAFRRTYFQAEARLLTADKQASFGLEVSSSERSQDQSDRKSTRLNSSHVKISYAVFCLKKKNKISRVR